MGFHEVQFPVDISYGSQGGPGFSTSVVITDSGAEQRIANWSAPRHKFNAAYAVRSYAQLQIVKEFYASRLGPANGFRFKDHFDFTSNVDGKTAPVNTDQTIGAGDGTLVNFQLVKLYGSSPVRTFKITKPVSGTIICTVNSVAKTEPADFSVNDATGVITFGVAPTAGHVITAGYEFDRPVRFGEDIDELLQASYENFGSGSISDIPLIELIDETPISDEFYYGGAQVNTTMDTSLTLTELNGRVQILTPTASGLKLFLPDFAVLPTGGPWFYIQNASGSNTISVRDADDAEVGIIAISSAMEIWLGLSDATTKKWYGLT